MHTNGPRAARLERRDERRIRHWTAVPWQQLWSTASWPRAPPAHLDEAIPVQQVRSRRPEGVCTIDRGQGHLSHAKCRLDVTTQWLGQTQKIVTARPPRRSDELFWRKKMHTCG